MSEINNFFNEFIIHVKIQVMFDDRREVTLRRNLTILHTSFPQNIYEVIKSLDDSGSHKF